MKLVQLVSPHGEETIQVPFEGDAYFALRKAGWTATVRSDDDDVLLKPWWCEVCAKPLRASQVEKASAICRTCNYEVRPRKVQESAS